MPTKKPKVQIILDENIYQKLKDIAEQDKRSISQMGSIIIENYIKNFEAQQNRTEQKSKLEKSSISKTG
ncbi:hypothetical protein [Enterocloster bolteae]|jgi:metal-responsive CopG/Arc/MetJ family transcriptional regulator|uniref:hypothetical protein n=1 Tax=Enterocloster bolteae TaxID=208479 RepID=UPI0002D1A228|nr:hypothetical protein [Enterocloster bolteae]ENZ70837.1 hypothetical protein HMPREF1096_02576 [Enterocloster bolteae 90B7]